MTIPSATRLQLEFLHRLLGDSVEEILARAVHDLHVVCIYRAAQTSSHDLATLVAAMHPPQEARRDASAPIPIPPPAPTREASQEGAGSDPWASLDPSAVEGDPSAAEVLRHAEMMTVDFASRGLCMEAKKYGGLEIDPAEAGRILGRAGWPRRPGSPTAPAIWLARPRA